jgi:hypothetical protein
MVLTQLWLGLLGLLEQLQLSLAQLVLLAPQEHLL